MIMVLKDNFIIMVVLLGLLVLVDLGGIVFIVHGGFCTDYDQLVGVLAWVDLGVFFLVVGVLIDVFGVRLESLLVHCFF
jgi:hypothetical protein